MIEDNSASGRKLYFPLKSRFYLGFDLVTGKKWDSIIIKLHFMQIVGHHQLHKFFRAFECGLMVDEDFIDVIAQIIANGANNDVAFLVDEERS